MATKDPHAGYDIKVGQASGGPSLEAMIDFWFEWLDYLELAASHGGFTVH